MGKKDTPLISPVPDDFNGLFDAQDNMIVLGDKQELLGFYKRWAIVKQETDDPFSPHVLHILIPDPNTEDRYYRNWFQFDYYGERPGSTIDAESQALNFIDTYVIPDEAPLPLLA